MVNVLSLAQKDVESALGTYRQLIAVAVGPHGRRALHYRAGRWLERAQRLDQAMVEYIKAFELAQASLLAPFNYSKLVWATLLGYVVFADLPSLNTLSGCALIIASGLYIVLRERPAGAE
jgi:hypothetical protein